ncbi:MAG: hypothetical protein JRJ47_12670 [Deltaproteobacteria bacterium]|nr:hypothetical protein [Deltaproteobacteria bacterium]
MAKPEQSSLEAIDVGPPPSWLFESINSDYEIDVEITGMEIVGELQAYGVEAILQESGEQHASIVSDDLTLIKGIGPKFASVLAAVGINTFEHLSLISVNDLRNILDGIGIGLADPSTWPEQARNLVE